MVEITPLGEAFLVSCTVCTGSHKKPRILGRFWSLGEAQEWAPGHEAIHK